MGSIRSSIYRQKHRQLPAISSADVANNRSNGLADPYFANVVLLVSGEGANNSTTIVDHTGRHTLTVADGAKIVTTDASFPLGAVDFDGVNDGILVTGNTSDFDFGTGAVCIETWAKLDSATQPGVVLNNYSGASPQGCYFAVTAAGGVPTGLVMRQGDAIIVSRTGGFSLGALVHLCFQRSVTNNASRMYVNGTKIGADITNFNATNLGRAANTGMGYTGPIYPTADEIDGRLGWLRVTKAERYWADFTPPTTPYPLF